MIIYALDISKALETPGTLANRQNGISARERVMVLVNMSREVRPVIQIDFSGINTTDVSFLDEFIPELILHLKTHIVIIFVSNLHEESYFALECVLAHRELKREVPQRITLLYKQGDTFSLCGSKPEPNLMAAMNVIFKRGEVSTREIADALDIPIFNASTRMKRLFDMKLIVRVRETGLPGRQHHYMLPRA